MTSNHSQQEFYQKEKLQTPGWLKVASKLDKEIAKILASNLEDHVKVKLYITTLEKFLTITAKYRSKIDSSNQKQPFHEKESFTLSASPFEFTEIPYEKQSVIDVDADDLDRDDLLEAIIKPRQNWKVLNEDFQKIQKLVEKPSSIRPKPTADTQTSPPRQAEFSSHMQQLDEMIKKIYESL
jgi:hypothetical protein